MRYLASLAALVLFAGAADAQCAGGNCQLLNGLTVRETTRNAQRTSITVRTQTVTQAAPRVVVQAAPVQTSSTTETVQVRQRVRLFRR